MTLNSKSTTIAVAKVLCESSGGGETEWLFWLGEAQAAIEAYLRAREAQGYVEVPVEPTPEMKRAARGAGIIDPRVAEAAWKLMQAARPQKEGE